MRRPLLLVLALVPVAGALAGWSFAAPGRSASAALPIGRSVTLSGDGERIQVTLLAFVDPARSCCYRPRTGTRFVAFKLRYVNLGRSRFTTVPAAGAELVDARGDFYDSTSTRYGSRMQPWPVVAPDLNHGLKLRPRERWTGYLGWVVPSTMRLRQFRYSLSYGYDAATWRLPSR